LEEKKKVWVNDCQIDTDLELLLPDSYVTNITERLLLYKELDNLESEADLEAFEVKLRDRFGPVPKATRELMDAIRLRKAAKELAFEKVVLKQKTFVGYFVNNPKSTFYGSAFFGQMMQYLTKYPQKARIKERNNKLTLVIENISGVHAAVEALNQFLLQFQTDHSTI
jgi:transcription-repair coupling factor (superfamily II helicase)